MANIDDQPDRLIGPATLATLVLLGIVVLAALWLRTGLIGGGQWPITWLDVEGELQRTSVSQIRAAAIGPASKGFFSVDLEQVRDAIQALPWVAGVEVSRQWPDALGIRIVEHQPVARWNDGFLLSDRGDLFSVDGSDGMQGLARLRGPDSRRQEVLDAWRTMRAELGAIGLDIQRLELDERGAWMLELGSGVELLLGREQIRERLARFISVHEVLRNQDRRPERVDMRYTNGLAVRWAAQPAAVSQHLKVPGDGGVGESSTGIEIQSGIKEQHG